MTQDNSEILSSTARQTFELVAEVRDVGRSIRQVAQEVGADTDADMPLADVPPAILEAFRRMAATNASLREVNATLQAERDDAEQRAANYKSQRDNAIMQRDEARNTVAALRAQLDEVMSQLAEATAQTERYEVLLRDMSAENHEAFAAWFQDHGDRILDMRRELVKDVLPEVIAVCEPADSVLYSRAADSKQTGDSVRLECDMYGVVWAPDEIMQERNAYEVALKESLETGDEPAANFLYIYSVEHLQYVNFTGYRDFRLPNSNSDRVFKVPTEQRYTLHTMEQPVGMESLWYCQWLLEPGSAEIRLAPQVRLRGRWNTCNVRKFHYAFAMAYAGEFSDKIFYEELPESLDISSAVECFKHQQWTVGGLCCMLQDVRARRYPTLDFAGAATSATQMMRAIPEKQNDWMPDYEQHFIAKNIGGTKPHTIYITRQYDFQMLKNWAYEDMIATLLTYSCKTTDGIKVGMQASAIAKLTQQDIAAITAKNITIFQSNSFMG